MKKKLYRSRKDKMLGGVAGGLAEYFEIDPTLVRIAFVVTLMLGGTGMLAYLILWIVVPEEPYTFPGSDTSTGSPTTDEQQTPGSSSPNDTFAAYTEAYTKQKQNRKSLAGWILIIIGALFLADNFIPHFCIGNFWPLILVAIGAGLLIKANNNK